MPPLLCPSMYFTNRATSGSVGFREAKVTHLARNPGQTPMKP